MPGLVLSLALLGAVLAVAIAQPHRPPESLVAVGSAGILLATGVVDWSAARDELSRLAPVLAFLAGVLVLGGCCAAEGVFSTVGGWLARSQPGPRLLLWVFVVAALVTSVLSLDATAVLLTPVVLAATSRLRVPLAPYAYATGHIANSGSLLLPTGNLTNLLALSVAGISLVHFAGLMLLPWLAVLAVEYAVFRRFFRTELAEPPLAAPATATLEDEASSTPWFAFAILALTLIGFVITSLAGVDAYWAAVAGATVLAGYAVWRGRLSPRGVVAAVDVPFLVFVMGLAVVVRAAVDHGLGDAAEQAVPSSETLPALLLMAGVAAVLANAVNNIPALLILLPAADQVGTLAVLAILIGVNVGPNLTYPGSLATLLWRRVLRDNGLVPSLARFSRLGILTVPVCLVVGVVGLWIGGQVIGG